MTKVPAPLDSVLRADSQPRFEGEDIWTVLPEDAEEAEYDSFGPSYDRVVQGKLYNRLVWGARISDWKAYAQEAIDTSGQDGAFLDIACGSLTFTADVYAKAERPVVLLDRSIAMLRMGRERLGQLGGNPHCAFLVADGQDLPFHEGAFATIVCHGALHHFVDIRATLRGMASCLAPAGDLYLTSLVDTGRWIGRRWMKMTQRMGHFAAIRTADEFVEVVSEVLGAPLDVEIKGSVVYVHATHS